MKLIRDLVASEYGGYWYTEIIHGSGSPAAEMIQMYREHDLDACKALALDALLPGPRRRLGRAPRRPRAGLGNELRPGSSLSHEHKGRRPSLCANARLDPVV